MKKLTAFTGVLVIFVVLLCTLPVSATEVLPVAAFSATRTSGTVPLSVTFVDASGNIPLSWSWTFGDGETSVEKNPSHTYIASGTYTVSLTATNTAGSNTVTKSGYITVTAPSPPVASFTTNATSGTVPLVILFNDTSTNSPTTWVWTFGDSSYSTLKNPVHTYSTEGTYTISLTATSSGGSATVTMNDLITVETAASPVASFTANSTSGITPLSVLFNDTSTNNPTSWTWSFGDGDEAYTQNTTHSYTEEGTYTVTLTAANSGGSTTVTQSEYITVEAAEEPVASFTTNVTSGAAPLSVFFNDTSTNNPTSWTWVFGDGDVSYEQNPVHEYTDAGTYTVSLTVTNDEGSDTITRSSCITVESEPVVSFTADVRYGTAPLVVAFEDTSTSSPTSWKWTFGDGSISYAENPTHTYSSAGDYTVSLMVSNDAGSDTVTRSLYITVASAMTTTIPITLTTVAVKTTVPPVTLQTTPGISNVTGSASGDAPLSGLLIPGGITLVVVSVIVVLLLVKRSRGRSTKWDL